MNVNDQVDRFDLVRLDLAKALKALGVKQDSRWYWSRCAIVSSSEYGQGAMKLMLRGIEPIPTVIEHYSAFSVAELGLLLPPFFHSYYDKYMKVWRCQSPLSFCDKYIGDGSGTRSLWKDADTEANARGLVLRSVLKLEGRKKNEVI